MYFGCQPLKGLRGQNIVPGVNVGACQAAGGVATNCRNVSYSNGSTAYLCDCVYTTPDAPQAPAPTVVNTSVNTQVSPQISPVFVQQDQPVNSPVNAATTQQSAQPAQPSVDYAAMLAKEKAEQLAREKALIAFLTERAPGQPVEQGIPQPAFTLPSETTAPSTTDAAPAFPTIPVIGALLGLFFLMKPKRK